MRCIITGTRYGRPDLWHWMYRFVARHGVPELWILGDATGVDTDAHELCMREGWVHRIYYADWRPMGVFNWRAGFDRNEKMVLAADPGDFCLGFPNGAIAFSHKKQAWFKDPSNGTRHCMRIALERKLRVFDMPHVRKIRPMGWAA